MNILLLAAGQGKRFTDAGYCPKPLIPVNGVPMWKHVLHNFLEQFFWPGKTNVYVATKKEYNICSKNANYKVINLENEQFGAAWSAYDALDMSACDVDEPLIILNCDQVIKYDGVSMYEQFKDCGKKFGDPGGGLVHFHEPNKEEKWGRSLLSEYGFINQIVEKTPVSDHAHAGYYYWGKTSDFFKYAQKLFSLDMKVNGEYFISPIYNLMIADGARWIQPFYVDGFKGIGVPDDLEDYLKNGMIVDNFGKNLRENDRKVKEIE